VLALSATQDGNARDVLLAGLSECLKIESSGTPHAVISERHRALLEQALREVEAADELLGGRGPQDAVLVACHLRGALEPLGLITGRVYSSELLDGVFSRFCIGK
jgi:tRNA modification GTPase